MNNKYLKELVISTILEGRELSREYLQAIVAALRGDEREIGLIMSSHAGDEETKKIIKDIIDTKYPLPENLKSYNPVLLGRPKGESIKTKWTCIQIAMDYDHLRSKGMSSVDAHTELVEISVGRYGKGLGLDAIKGAVTKGRKRIQKEKEQVDEIMRKIHCDAPMIPIEE